ncbi:TlpA disulfide reductase family protein [Chitinophaga japonensis]|uniref:Peroxiredoxin n=1 Tax=Chitinophaga japonensis TaxID=104662 RepID=A0A562SSX6_CHIJA|nr:TlpA disulfide reductase family protein [Chitinophaga japonensis]TWI84389.1 peroxiredoxin [Chitinophaga japonensis]
MITLRPFLYLLALGALPALSSSAQQAFVDGPWQARLHRQDGADIVFNAEVKDSAGKKVLYVLNAGERLLVDDIQLEGDSLFIKMPFFDSEFRAALQPDGKVKGLWIRHLANRDMSIPFTAIPGVRERFAQHLPAKGNVSGRWATWFTAPDGTDSSFAVGEFRQQGSRVTGTFLTATGDYRFLEGIMDGDTLKLSTFDGSHAYYFTARLTARGILEQGVFYAGIGSGKESWTARRDDKAALPDETTLASVKPGQEKLDFTFPDMNGTPVSIKDERFTGKVVIITLLGSWCPNCMDETAYLSQWYQKNKHRGIEIIGLAYERTPDFEKSRKSLTGFLRRFDVQFPVLITGATPSDPQKAEKTLPQLTAIKGFPTTIFVDRQGRVKEVHTGFSGPGTGEHYERFKRDFNRLVDEMLEN